MFVHARMNALPHSASCARRASITSPSPGVRRPARPAHMVGRAGQCGVRTRAAGRHVEGASSRASARLAKFGVAPARHAVAGLGRPVSSEQVLRGLTSRRQLAAQVAEAGATDRRTPTCCIPAPRPAARPRRRGVAALPLLRPQLGAGAAPSRSCAAVHRTGAGAFEQAERQSLDGVAHVFTFGAYVRDNLIAHYGLAPDRVTAVGSGMGAIQPWHGPKTIDRPRCCSSPSICSRPRAACCCSRPSSIARQRRPRSRADHRRRSAQPRLRAATCAGIEFRAPSAVGGAAAPLSRSRRCWCSRCSTTRGARSISRRWSSRTPVMGLARNGLPELVDGGRHGFLVDRADPEALAEAILSARLRSAAARAHGSDAPSAMSCATHSWDRVAERIAYPLNGRSRNREVPQARQEKSPSSPASPDRTAPISPTSCCSAATSCTASSAAPRSLNTEPHRLSLPRPPRRRRAAVPALRRHDRFDQPDAAGAARSSRPRSTISPRKATCR